MSWVRLFARSSVSSRSCVLRRTSSLRAAAAVSSSSFAVNSRFSRSRSSSRSRGWAWDIGRLRLSPPLSDATSILEVLTTTRHQRHERIMVLRQHCGANALHRLRERLERLGAEIIEALDLIIKLRTLLRHARRHLELRVERRARHLRE